MRMKPQFFISCVPPAPAGGASAKAPPAPATPPAQTAPPAVGRANDCAPMQAAPQRGTVAPAGATTGQRAAPLRDELARSHVVLCPPSGADPESRAPTPDTGTTPVIPPPGSPGGDPNVRPK